MPTADRSDVAAAALDEQLLEEHVPSWRRFFQELSASPKGLTGFVIIVLVLLVAILAPWLVPHDPTDQVLQNRFLPSAFGEGGALSHFLGGDNMGRDVLSRVILGTRTSVTVALLVVGIAMVVGSAFGVVSGYFGGFIDNVMMRIADLQLSFPFILLALMLVAIFSPGYWTLVLALTVAIWVNYARLLRGEALRIRQLEFIQAARSIGVRPHLIMLTHVLPNALPSIIVLATLDIAFIIIAEAAMSFLGLGIQPPTPSWGTMISDGRNYLFEGPWITIGPGLAIMVTSIGINLFGDFLRDTYDPRLTRI